MSDTTRPSSAPGDGDAHATRRDVEHVDLLVVGAGLSGVGVAAQLHRDFPGRSLAVVESRDAIGGTWDLFRYPGVRSDSDMFTLGYGFRPWRDRRAIAPGAAIRDYVRETAAETGIASLIRFGHRVVAADWSSADARWTVTIEVATAAGPGGSAGAADASSEGGAGAAPASRRVTITCSFLFVCSGYYRYDEGWSPAFPGQESFAGRVVHPQHWPEDLDVTGKRVVVIGSGATAVTLVPALAETAEQVTMLQRSPTYVLSLPSRRKEPWAWRRLLPRSVDDRLIRWRSIAMALLSFQTSRRSPEKMKAFLRAQVARRLPDDFDVDRHFQPSYDPWDQRLCITPDGALFRALRSGSASVVTDDIDSFTPAGVRVAGRDGQRTEELAADVVVTATGLNLLLFGGIRLSVDGVEVDPATRLTYKGFMLSGVPNLAFAIGYTNASWTLKIDLVVHYVTRLLRHADRHGYRSVVPVAPTRPGPTSPLIDLTSGYVSRGVHLMPRQGARSPWRMHQNYPRDVWLMRHSTLTRDGMRFER
ncbi:NAD(P)/FAD-dependent oxidoreductase [Frigoribacterium sp. PhB24]|uniref:flavin-containing monooxygenase n=1 Tax=Frigoribacterium sp. PhB24 TaxID=2485204 RepID=UPI000F49E5AE|nr:NAD(P)/FAD-dependent oxidoreductase [Frigoribacterium sp. PhB24]ROS54155.1 cation diffusion facilitator CzcD-associated flavoprotein CzcO [Frigoribacterium sp. PhB24]